MQIRGHDVITIDKFNGRWNRGQDDVVPLDHASSEQNNIFEFNGVRTRPGIRTANPSFGAKVPIRVRSYVNSSNTTRFLYMVSGGDIYNPSVSNVTPIYSPGSGIDFIVFVFNTHIYISVLSSAGAVSGGSLQIYDDASTCRAAAGAEPTFAGTFAAAASAGAGHIDKGNYLISVAYETNSGFITSFSNNILLFAAPASKKITLTNIPTGPAGTSARRIVISKVFHKAYSNNYKDYEMFFAIGGRITDNTTTTLDLNFYSNDLADSADYLIDQLANIPSCIAMASYNNSLILAGCDGDSDGTIKVSASGSPESFDSTDGFLVAGYGDNGGDVQALEAYRGQLNIHKQNRSYVTVANGDAPNTWTINDLDLGIGCYVHGVSQLPDAQGNTSNYYLLIATGGLFLYDGRIQQVPLTYKINDDFIAALATVSDGYNYSVCIDPVAKYIYLYVGTYLFAGNFQDGLTPEAIKWSNWSCPVTPLSIFICGQTDQSPNPSLYIGCSASRPMQLKANTFTTDTDSSGSNVGINSYYETALIPNDSSGVQYHYDATRVRVYGRGSLVITVTSEDAVTTITPTALTMSQSAGKEIERRFNLRSGRAKILLQANGVGSLGNGDYYIITLIRLLVKLINTTIPS